MNTSNAQNNEFVFFRPRPDGDIDPAGEAGWFLQRQREEAGISLEEASRAVNIYASHLAAIEQGDLTGLPPRHDAMNMIGSYATYLGFDPVPLVKHFAKFLPRQPMPGHRGLSGKKGTKRPAPLSSATILKFPVMDRLRSVASGAGGVVASTLAVVMLFGAASWVFMPGDGVVTDTSAPMVAGIDRQKTEQVASISTISEQPMPDNMGKKDKAATAADKSAGSLTGLDQLIAKNIANIEIPTASLPAVKSKDVQKVGESQANTSGGQVYGTENKNSRLTLKANSNVWVRIEDDRGNVVMTRTLMAGDSYRVPVRKGLVVIARDGGLLSYTVDGANKGNLGREGEILVGRSLDLTKLAKSKG